jgi:hypothetical protein
MSQAGDQLVEQINALTARVQQIVQDGANAETEKADHAADLANVGQAVQGLAATLPTPPAPSEG